MTPLAVVTLLVIALRRMDAEPRRLLPAQRDHRGAGVHHEAHVVAVDHGVGLEVPIGAARDRGRAWIGRLRARRFHSRAGGRHVAAVRLQQLRRNGGQRDHEGGEDEDLAHGIAAVLISRDQSTTACTRR